ncbi:MAG: 2-amino-4-hydroxy-6-hydroxymethyldihydropteridine diphosphokinase [Candidatus Sumerlaeaceae bacterium]|nr:2-amino-4-hydroxy-6-hydroxymethyldihydropteridine diphosphokinase [Candidatus Sumerlaeaceae bacterium]
MAATAALWKRAYLGLGANLPTYQSPDQTIAAACSLLDRTASIRIAAASSVYRSKPWGKFDQPDFYNAVVKIETVLSPVELLQVAKGIERELGRTPTYRWGPRVIDIDVLLYNRTNWNQENLIIPHQHLLERPFVFVPLLEIAPDVMMPDGRLIMHLVPHQPPEFFGLAKVGELQWEKLP